METRAIIAVCSLLAASLALAEGAYRWVDEDGVVHYSDVPREGADYVDLAGYSRPTGARIGPTRSVTSGDAASASDDDGPFEYESLEISSPGPEETLWNIEGTLNVSLALQPGLQQGHQVRVYFDGEPRMVQGTSFTIDEVWRGVHNIQAEVLDGSGRLMIRSRTNRFYVQQNSIIQRRPVP